LTDTTLLVVFNSRMVAALLQAAWIQTRLSTAWASFFWHLLMLPLLCHVFFTLRRTVSRPVSGASGALTQSLCQNDAGATGSAMEIHLAVAF
jgi:hypothetical protein